MPDNNTLYILDSYGLIYRAYYAFINRPLINKNGENISAVFGFFRNFHRILKDYKPQYILAAMDSRTPTFRHELFDQYKATRQKTPEDLHAQIPVIEEILTALGVPILRCDGFEADDVIATLAAGCEKSGRQCRILSGDKDLMQLVTDTTLMLKPDKAGGGWVLIDKQGVEAEWGVKPEQMRDMLSLIGDTADNIPGVKGIGEKTAQKLLADYKTLDGIYANIDSIKGATQKKLIDGKDSAYFSQKLVELCYNVPVCASIDELKLISPDYKSAAKILEHAGAYAVAKSYAADAIEAGATGIVADDVDAAAPALSDFALQDEAPQAQLVQNSGDYTPVHSIEELHTIIDEIKQNSFCAFDLETDGLNPHQANMVGFSLCYKTGKSFYVPFTSAERGTFDAPEYIDKAAALKELSAIFSDQNMTVITHNGKFDYQVLRSNGLAKPCCRFIDTMVAAWLLNPDYSSLSLETLSKNVLGLQTISFESLVSKAEMSKGKTFADVPLKDAVPYAAEDADLTLKLWQKLEPELAKAGLTELFTSIEMNVLPVLAEMEIEGIHVDTQKLADYRVELVADIEKTQAEIIDIVGHDFNIASTKQLQQVLFEERKLPATKKTKTGYSTDTAVLEELAPLDPVPKKILEYRSLTKLLSTYVDTLPSLADKNGRIHTSFMQTGTATGRLSSKDPNLQNIPVREEAGRRIRSAFTAEPGKVLVSADYSQIELVLLAHLSGDKNLQKAFNDGVDVHKATASLIFGVPAEQVTAEQRRTAKTINFGVMYGMSAFRLSNELGIPRGTAKEFIDSYFATYSGVQDFIRAVIEKCETSGYVETIFNRKRFIRNINAKNKNEKSAAERMAVNTPIQGSAADIVKKAMIAVQNAIESAGLKAKLLLQVHDELIVECPAEECEAVKKLLQTEMEGVAKLNVPLKVSVESGENWGMFH
ncbi:MAG: DNA polymerase I [Spirochaetales bacterium]|nr:DNA polymerase I [Spirochaetales bacterium]